MITLDGKTDADLNLIVLAEGEDIFTPSTRDRSVNVPGRNGAYDFGADLGVLEFNIPMMLKGGATLADTQKQIREIAKILLDQDGKPRTFELRWDYEPEKYYTVRYAGSLSLERILKMGKFVLPLVAYDPAAYATSTAYDEAPGQYDTGLQYDSGLMYENYSTFNWQYSKQYFGTYNYSYYKTPVKITIQGAVINPRITNQMTDETIYLPTLTATDTLEVDMEKYTVKKNGLNALKDYRGSFFVLVSGDNSLLFDGGSPNATVIIEWKHKFL